MKDKRGQGQEHAQTKLMLGSTRNFVMLVESWRLGVCLGDCDMMAMEGYFWETR
jgi:hypothetical protein